MIRFLPKTAAALLLIIVYPAVSVCITERKNTIDWIKGVIISYGSSSVRLNREGKPLDDFDRLPVSLNSARKFSYSRARDKARENLVRLIRNVQVDSMKSFGQMIRENSDTRSRISDFLEKRITLKQYPVDFFTSGCRMELKLSSLLAALPYRYPGDPLPVIRNNPIPTEYSGLIVDTRGLGIRPMLLPSIYNEEGLEIYGRYFINIHQASKRNPVKYAFDETEAMKNSLAGERPYFSAALANRNGSPVLSNRDVKKILSSRITRENLRDCRVIFIIDRKK